MNSKIETLRSKVTGTKRPDAGGRKRSACTGALDAVIEPQLFV